MHVFKKDNIKTDVQVLSSFDDFSTWYLSHCDFSMFDEQAVRALLDEEKPDFYPCIPLMSDEKHEVIYIGIDLVTHWFTAV
ncbi:hypothetical protein [Rahnella sp. PCH160]|uniref:hypothetical protein n=1 Tax=Rahnella sp. PCH160 TaxID=3447928 RepID=UPI0039FC7A8B